MKKTLISIFIISASFNFSFAEDGFINSILESKASAIKEIKGLFTDKKIEVKAETTAGAKMLMSDPEIKEVTLEKIETTKSVKEIKPVLLCENRLKLKEKKDKINLNIKNQIKDKNKLTDKLLEIASSVSTSSKEVIEEKIIKLETEVGNAIKIQRNILNIIASSTENICEPVSGGTSEVVSVSKKVSSVKVIKLENKDYVALNKSINKLELDNDKQLDKINTLIKKDIKNILVEINSEESN